ncbi:MAG: ATP-binding cassette domain-containing protein, partial [Tuberibacillus sp.]
MIGKEKLLEVKGLVKHFPSGTDTVQAVNGVDFDIYKGETVSLVGESGCGKSTTGRLTLRLIEATAGDIIFEGKNLVEINKAKELKRLRQEMQIIFQDPYASLDPRKTIGETIGRPLTVHKLVPRKERADRVTYLMDKVGL